MKSSMLNLFFLVFVSTISVKCQTLRQLGSIPAPHAAFARLVKMQNTRSLVQHRLIISGFNPLPFFHDTIYQVPDIGQHLDNLSQASVTEVTRQVTWPNEVHYVPDAVFGKSGYVVAAGGFLVPFKDHGTLTLFDLNLSPPVRHVLMDSGEDSKWFYHRVHWKDMNGDGLLDMVTCRARTHLLGHTEGQLLWFEHPQQNALSQAWRSHVINEGGDVFFAIASLPTSEGQKDCIITAAFFSDSLNVFWSTSPEDRWDDSSLIRKRVIDSTIGAVFDVEVTDLNMDGTLDLLVTNNALKNASVFAFTVPSDFRTGTFSRRLLSSGYASRTSGMGHGAPGSCVLVHPQTNSTSQKPLIIVSGDDDGQAHILSPSSNAHSDWSYQSSTFLDVSTSTVGGIAVGDVNDDGYNEVFVPSFSEGLVYVFTFKP